MSKHRREEREGGGQQMNIGVGRLTTDDIFFLTTVRSHSPARNCVSEFNLTIVKES